MSHFNLAIVDIFMIFKQLRLTNIHFSTFFLSVGQSFIAVTDSFRITES